MSLHRHLFLAVVLIAAGAARAQDAPRAGFERLLGQPIAVATASTVDGEREHDPVLAGFRRMLDHQPSHHVPPLPADFEPDPLIAAVALPLLRSNRVVLAGVASAGGI